MEITLEITSYCPYGCDYCSTMASEEGEHLPFEVIEEYLTTMSWEGIDRINISGGEPLAHPDFYRILTLCQSLAPQVWVYTNALQKIIYNADIVHELEVHANVCLVPGRKHYIPQKADKVHLLQLVPQGRARDMQPANFQISGQLNHRCHNCQHQVLQADGQVVSGPCKKTYDKERYVA